MLPRMCSPCSLTMRGRGRQPESMRACPCAPVMGGVFALQEEEGGLGGFDDALDMSSELPRYRIPSAPGIPVPVQDHN